MKNSIKQLKCRSSKLAICSKPRWYNEHLGHKYPLYAPVLAVLGPTRGQCTEAVVKLMAVWRAELEYAWGLDEEASFWNDNEESVPVVINATCFQGSSSCLCPLLSSESFKYPGHQFPGQTAEPFYYHGKHGFILPSPQYLHFKVFSL